jgi:hypothetical protein
LGLLLSAGLAVSYHWRVRHRRRSYHRATRDRIMIGCIVAGLALPTALAIAVLAGPPEVWSPPLRSVPAHIAVIAAVAVFTSMLTSSCFDWYLIRSFRDGVLGEPACRTTEQDNEAALFYARAWIAHRTVAEIVGWGGTAIVLIVSIVAVQHLTTNPTWSGVLTYLAPSGAVYVAVGGYLLRRLRYVPQYAQRPSPGLGRWVTGVVSNNEGEERHIDGFVVDVALGDGVQIISQDRSRKNVDLRDSFDLNVSEHELCPEACEHWIPQCERGLLEQEQKKPH